MELSNGHWNTEDLIICTQLHIHNNIHIINKQTSRQSVRYNWKMICIPNHITLLRSGKSKFHVLHFQYWHLNSCSNCLCHSCAPVFQSTTAILSIFTYNRTCLHHTSLYDRFWHWPHSVVSFGKRSHYSTTPNDKDVLTRATLCHNLACMSLG